MPCGQTIGLSGFPACIGDCHTCGAEAHTGVSLTLNGKDYAGRDSRSYEAERDHPVYVGEQITASVSASHPGLSALGSTGGAWIGLPIFVIISVFELMLFGILLSGVLRIFLGVSLVSEQAGPVVTLIVSAFFVVLLVAAALGRQKKGVWRFRVYRSDG